jgi:hypothetical protein
MHNQINNWSFGGEYVAEIKSPDGSVRYPFGEKPLKNLILDTFLLSLASGYRHNPQAYIQSCILSTGDTAPERSQTGIVGPILATTHASDYFSTLVDTGNSAAAIARNFRFNPVTGPSTYREAAIGCFGLGGVDNITTSRIVFPSDINLTAGEQFYLNYKLSMGMPWLTKDVPFVASGNGLVFSGALRSSTNNSGIFAYITSTTCYFTLDQFVPTNIVSYRTRNFTNNDPTTSAGSSNATPNMAYSTFIPTKTGSYLRRDFNPLSKIGFYGSGHVPSGYHPNNGFFGDTANFPPPYTAIGTNGSANRLLAGTGVSGAYSTINYSFSPESYDRIVSGIYLNSDQEDSWRYNAYRLYFKFTTGCFIPAGKSVDLKIQWQLNRG